MTHIQPAAIENPLLLQLENLRRHHRRPVITEDPALPVINHKPLNVHNATSPRNLTRSD
jgi:hypothetical protein